MSYMNSLFWSLIQCSSIQEQSFTINYGLSTRRAIHTCGWREVLSYEYCAILDACML